MSYGMKKQIDLPSGTITFLFTDIEGSSSLWELFSEAMKPALAAHDAILRSAIQINHGQIIKTTGDGVHAVFSTALDAIKAAISAQIDIHSKITDPPIKVRMGLHTGESQVRDGDYYGTEVNRAARIMEIGHGGQILLSEVTAALVRVALPKETSLNPLGAHRLKGLTAPEEIYQLDHPKLSATFPPLNSLETYQHNLPVQLTSFIGRQREMEQIKSLLAQTRLLTLVGPGGTGKTRLALETAAKLIDQFLDGVWLVELAPLTNPDLILERVATTLNVQEPRGRPILDTLTNYLRHKQLLLLLDNVEHLIRESADFAEHILINCPQLKILVTGREALFIGGETTLQIPSLSLPGGPESTPEEIANTESAQLFLVRAQAVRPDFEINADNAPALVEVVRRLDGIPLALELAAARLRMMSVQQIAERLNDRFRLLTGGQRTALPRQQTLQALIDWSWNLLDEQEQVLLRRLSVFSGGSTLEAAQAVAGDDQLGAFEILDLLEQLINKSLVNVEHLPKGDVRYSILESIRQYARDRLFEAGEGENLRNRHAEYFVRFSENISRILEGPDIFVWLDRFLRESDNGRAAREWALESRLDLALRMTEATMLVQRYWFFPKDGYRWLEQVVAKARLHPALATDPAYQRGLACATISLGAATMGQGESAKAVPILEEGIALAKIAGVIRHRVFGLNMLLISLLQLGELQTAEGIAEEALEISRTYDLDFLRMMTLGSFTPIFAFQGKHEDALTYTAEAIQLAKRFHNPWADAMSLLLKGHSERGKQNLAEAEADYLESSRLFEAVRDTPFMYISLSEAGHMKRRLGDYAGAEKIYRKTILFFQDGVGKSAVIHQLECFGMTAAYQNQYERAARLLGAAQSLRNSENSVRLPPEQIEFNEALDYLDKRLGAKQWETFKEAGSRLQVDEAVEFALETSAE